MTERYLEAAAAPLSPRRLLAATPAGVWWLVVLQVALGLLYGVAVPVLHGPDEYAHVDRVLGDTLAAEDPGITDRAVAAAALVSLRPVDGPVFAPTRATDVVEPQPAADRPTWRELGTGTTAVEVSQAWDQPATHYAVVGAIDRVVQSIDAADAWDQRVGRLRAVHALLMGVLPWAAWWLALRLTRSRGTSYGAALLPLTLPMVAQTGGVVNNDASIAALGGLCLLGLGWAASGDDGPGSAWVAGGAGGLATATKVFGVAAPAWFVVTIAVLRLDARTRRWPRPAWWGHAVAAGLLFGAWWPALQLVKAGTLAPRRYTYPVLDDFEPSVVTWLGEAGRRIPETFVGSLGVEQFPAPLVVTLVATALLVLVAAVGVGVLRWRSLVLLAPAGTALVMMAYASWGAYTRSALPSGLRGRYLLVGLVGLAVLVAAGLRRAARSDGASVVALAGFGLVLHGILLARAVEGLWVGDGLVASARTAFAAAPLGRVTTASVALVAIVAVAGAGRSLARDLRSGQPGSVPA